MSAQDLGLIELLLVFGAVIGFAVWQFVSVRRLLKRPPDEKDERYSRTDWVLITRDQAFLASDLVQRASSEIKVPEKLSLWTDDFNNLLRILK